MIEVITHWDRGWFEPRNEAFIFRQPCEAYGVDRVIFVGPVQEGIARVEQFATLPEALATCTGQRVFLEPTGEKTLSDIPEGDVTLIFGNTCDDNLRYSKPEERYRFDMKIPKHHGIFSVTAVGIVLAHRYGQSWL